MKASKASIIISTLLMVAFLITAATPVIAAPQETVRVWVSYQSSHKAEVAQALKRVNASFHYDFPELEAYVVSLPAAALNGIQRNPFVLDVEEDAKRYPIEPVKLNLSSVFADTVDVNGQTVPWGIDAVQARDIWDADKDAAVDAGAPTGEGIKVCIIDSGYYAGHADLMDNASGISQVDDNYLRDGLGHGSHVAGTISALNNDFGVVGVTPGTVSYHIVKIFADDGSWTSASDLTAAIYNCRDNSADIISMSLGGTSSNRKEQRAFDSVYSAGILHVAAAGNEQIETPGAYSYPASYSSVISVAAVDSDLNVADFSLQNSAVEVAAPGVGVLSTVPWIEGTAVTVDGVDYRATLIEFANTATKSGALVDGGLCTTTGAWSGKVVLCQRGDISFYDKVMNVQNSGGVAAVIYNNVAGIFSGTLGEGSTSTIIAVSMSQEDGQYLVENKLGQNATVAYSQPELCPTCLEAWDGTSMATPHVAGVAALIWSANPSWTNVQIRNALTATAQDLGAAGRDSLYGYGLVQAKDALLYLGGVLPTPPPTGSPTPTDTPTATPTPTDTPTVTPTPTDTPTPTVTPVPGALVLTFTSPADGATFADRAVVKITALVQSDGAAVSGATVAGLLTTANGTKFTLSGVTGTDGSVSFSFRVNQRKYGTGAYTVDLTATKDGYTSHSATLTFYVQ